MKRSFETDSDSDLSDDNDENHPDEHQLKSIKKKRRKLRVDLIYLSPSCPKEMQEQIVLSMIELNVVVHYSDCNIRSKCILMFSIAN